MDFSTWAKEDEYVYVGLMNPHYGHFLVNSLSRLWWLQNADLPASKLLCHCPAHPQSLAGIDFIASILSLLNIDINILEVFSDRTRIKNVIIPQTSFQEQYAIHKDFRSLCLSIGMRVSGYSTETKRMIYISKSKLRQGVGIIEAEAELEHEAMQLGCDIIHPENIPFREQIRLISSSSVIIGTVGSALHTTIFCPGGKTIIGLNPGQDVNSNFQLIDILTGNDVYYFAPMDGQMQHVSSGQFLTTHRPADPSRLASGFFSEVKKILATL